MITMDSMVRAIGDMVSTNLGDEVAVLHLQKGTYYGLEGVGGRIWSLIKTPIKVSDIYQTILNEYEVEADVCAQELFAFLNHMVDEELITVQESNNNFKN